MGDLQLSFTGFREWSEIFQQGSRAGVHSVQDHCRGMNQILTSSWSGASCMYRWSQAWKLRPGVRFKFRPSSTSVSIAGHSEARRMCCSWVHRMWCRHRQMRRTKMIGTVARRMYLCKKKKKDQKEKRKRNCNYCIYIYTQCDPWSWKQLSVAAGSKL